MKKILKKFEKIQREGIWYRRFLLVLCTSILFGITYYGIMLISIYVLPDNALQLLSVIDARYPNVINDVAGTIVLYYVPYGFIVVGTALLYFFIMRFIWRFAYRVTRRFAKKHTEKMCKKLDAIDKMNNTKKVVKPAVEEDIEEKSTSSKSKKSNKSKKKKKRS